MSEARKKAEAENAACDFLLDLMLESDMPEERKVGLHIMKAARNLHEAISNIVGEYADPTKEVPYETAKQVAEYLGLVHTGIMQFMETQNNQCTE
ncbi:hypothetical protein [Anaerovibrio slackiae]|uniref:hypothetical protein n=1 Tax=Anaerovibrio slackiae TaxID=2652309 RepID=UPI0038630D04